MNFSKTTVRTWSSDKHKAKTVKQISEIDMPFVRIGCSGDPSENWNHTLSVCRDIAGAGKEIVIITRHWCILTDNQLEQIKALPICINTSVSALDEDSDMAISLMQYARLKPFCKSALRVISCDFNQNNEKGAKLSKIQDALLSNENVIETVFRPTSKNKFVTDGVVNVAKHKFVRSVQLSSKRNDSIFMGKCAACKEKCGAAFDKT